MDVKKVTVRVPMNIALIKYWGKRNEELILPLNDSISLTVDDLYATTTIEIIEQQTQHSVSINGKAIDLSSNKRYERVFNEAIRLMRKRMVDESKLVTYHFKVSSVTNFPVAAGLASSAAGFAAIGFALQQLLSLDDLQANRLARIGSGSACRSMYGGLVHWRKGNEESGSDCFSQQVSTNSWSLKCIIFVFNDGEKKVGSSVGMRRSAATSELLKHRIEHLVDERIAGIKKAYEAQDFDAFAELIMKDSNQFHAICLDTHPPINYLTESSWKLIECVHEFNDKSTNGRKAAYTFDAGPNACVIVREQHVSEFLEHAASFVDTTNGEISPSGDSRAHKASKLIVSSMGAAPIVLE